MVRMYDTMRRHTVTLFDAFAIPRQSQLSLMVEYMDGGSLQDIVDAGGCPDEGVLANIAQQTLMGLHYLHRAMQVMHRDIKPANLLIDSRGCVKISDFGIARGKTIGASGTNSETETISAVAVPMSLSLSERHTFAKTFCGTLTYMSPERLNGEQYTFSADVWSVGLSVMTCALGRFPLHSNVTSKPGGGVGGGPQGASKNNYWSLCQYVGDELPQRVKALVDNSGRGVETRLGAGNSDDDNDNGVQGEGKDQDDDYAREGKEEEAEDAQEGDWDGNSNAEWSLGFRDFLMCCLERDPTDRATCAELLVHEFVTDNAYPVDVAPVGGDVVDEEFPAPEGEEEEQCDYTLDDYDAEDESAMELRCVQAELLSHQVSLHRQWLQQQAKCETSKSVEQSKVNPAGPKLLFTQEVVPVLARRLSASLGLPLPVVRDALSVTHTQIVEMILAEKQTE